VKILILRRLGLVDKSIPVILATRGEFAQSALLQNSIKKKIYIAFFKLFKIYDGINYHVSSSLEYEDLTRVFNRRQYNKIFVLNDLSLIDPIDIKDKIGTINNSAKILKICFVSRVSQVKNLDYALRVLSKVRVNIVFDIYGPISNNNYWIQCKKLIEEMPENVSVNYRGSVDHNVVQSTIAKYDIFFLPTKGENFGHIIIEALSSATPVLISDNTQWSDINKYKSGWAIPLSRSDKFIETIERFSDLDLSKRQKFSESSLNYYIKKMDQTSLIENYKQVFGYITK
jgi:glycosyltransferase involved in cell wall biosynthesis